MKKNFQYFLRPDTTDYYHAVGGVASVTATATPLKADVLEWSATEIQWTRHRSYHGVFRSFIIPLTFVKDGAAILKHIYYTQGVSGNCIFEVHRLNKTTQLYELMYSGKVDFSQAEAEDQTFKVAVVEGGLASILQRKDRTPFEIPIMDSDSNKVYMDGVMLRANAHYIVPMQGQSSAIRLSFAFNTFPAGGGEGLNGSIQTATTVTPPQRVIYEAQYPETVTINVHDLYVNVFWPSVASGPGKFGLRIAYTPISGATTIDFWQAPSFLNPGSSATYLINGSHTFPLPAGGQVEIEQVMVDSTGLMIIENTSTFKVLDDNGTIDIYSEYTRPPSTIRTYTYKQLFEKLAALMAPGYSTASDYLDTPALVNYDNRPYYTHVTSGNAMRGLGDGSGGIGALPAKITTTFADLRQDSGSRDMTGIGIEDDTLRLERMPYFYDNTVVTVDLGLINNFRQYPLLDFVYNLFRFGYNVNETDKLNGKDDVLLTQTYSADLLDSKREADWISPYIASYISQEYTRGESSTKVSTDTKSDNDVFLLEVNSTLNSNGEYTLARRQNDTGNTATGLFANTTAYNLALSPKRNVLRNGPLVATALHLFNGSLKYQTADQNAELQAKLSTVVGTVVEKLDIPVANLPAPLFLPIGFSFDTAVPRDLADLIASNPYGRVNFQWRNPRTGELVDLGGFIDEVSIRPATQAVCTWKIIAAPDTDLSKLY